MSLDHGFELFSKTAAGQGASLDLRGVFDEVYRGLGWNKNGGTFVPSTPSARDFLPGVRAALEELNGFSIFFSGGGPAFDLVEEGVKIDFKNVDERLAKDIVAGSSPAGHVAIKRVCEASMQHPIIPYKVNEAVDQSYDSLPEYLKNHTLRSGLSPIDWLRIIRQNPDMLANQYVAAARPDGFAEPISTFLAVGGQRSNSTYPIAELYRADRFTQLTGYLVLTPAPRAPENPDSRLESLLKELRSCPQAEQNRPAKT